MTFNKFIKILLSATFCLIIIDVILGGSLRHFYFKIRSGEQGRTTYAADSCTGDYVILGSSRAEHHYVSSVISNVLQTSCYNAGKDKQRLIYCLAMLKMLYTRYTPKHIILDLNPQAFETKENGLEELSALLPYYHSHPEIQKIVNERNRFEWAKASSNLYCFNSLPLKIIFNNLSHEQEATGLQGYVPLTTNKEIIPPKPDTLYESTKIDPDLIRCFEEIISLCQQHKSMLYVVISPIYNVLPKNIRTLVLADSICKRLNIPFLNYSDLSEFNDHASQSFVDVSHLNDSCARVFSGKLAFDLKKYL